MNIREKTELALISLLVIFLPSQLGKHYWFKDSYLSGIRIDYLSPTFFFLDFLVLLLLFFSVYQRKKTFLNTRKIVNLIFILLFICLNIFFSPSKIIALYLYLRTVELTALVFWVKTLSRQGERRLHQTLPFPVIIASLLAIVQFLKNSSLKGIFYWLGERAFSISTPSIARTVFMGREFLRPYSTFSHPNSLAGFIATCMILIIFNRKKIPPLLYFSSLILGSTATVLTVSQASWIALLLVFLSYLIFTSRKKLSVAVLPAALILFSFLITFFPLEKQSVNLRLEGMQKAVVIFKQHPVFGVGLGNYLIAAYQQNSFRAPEPSLILFQPVHNIFLLLLTEVGLPGLFIFLNFIYGCLKNSFTLDSAAAFFALMFILLTGMLDHYWLTLIQNQFLLALVLGLSLRRQA